MIVFSKCKCDLRQQSVLFIREGYLKTINSILNLYNEWCLNILKNKLLRFSTNTIGIVSIEYFQKEWKDSFISFPIIICTEQWIAWKNNINIFDFEVAQDFHNFKYEIDCGICSTHITDVPTTIRINGTIMFQQIYSVIDARRPHVYKFEKEKKNKRNSTFEMLAKSSCYRNGKFISCINPITKEEYTSNNPILINSGSLALQRTYSISSTFIKKLTELIDFYILGTLTKKQALLESSKLLSGDIDTIFSKRGGYQSHEDYEESSQSKLVTAFERGNSRYQQIKNTSIQRLQFPLMIFKLIRSKHKVMSNRLFNECEEGFLSIGYVTESSNTGMQSTIVLGTEFSLKEKSWYDIELHFIEYIKKTNVLCKHINVLWGNEMVIRQLLLPVDPIHQFNILIKLECDFTIFNNELYFMSSYDSQMLCSLLFTKHRVTIITLDYFKRILGLDLKVPNFSLLEFLSPCLNSSHSPKVMQTIYHLKQAIDDYNENAVCKESSKMYLNSVTTAPMGCSIKNVPTVETTCIYKINLYNDQDGVILSRNFVNQLNSISYRTIAAMMIGCTNVNSIIPANSRLFPDDIIVQIFAEKVSLSNNYLKCNMVSKNNWLVTFTREYSNKSIFLHSLSYSNKIVTIILKSFHHTSIGDKLTSLHGQKCTLAKESVSELNYISPVCLKRLPLGEFQYGHIVTLVKEKLLNPLYAQICFGYEYLFMNKEEKIKFIKTIMSFTTNSITMYMFRLVQEADCTLSFSNTQSINRDKWVGQNMKGLINTGASSYTLPEMQSLEFMGLTFTEFLLRLGVENPKEYKLLKNGVVIDMTTNTILLVLSQFNTFNINFK